MNPEIISKIIEQNILAASPSQLAATLGYSGRSTINRLRGCTGGEEAMREFCHRINEVIGLSCEDIITIDRLIELKNEFTYQMIKEVGKLSDNVKLKIVYAFIDDDYSIFSDSYREMALNKWLLLKGHERDIFFYMLSFFLLQDKIKSYYSKHIEVLDAYKKILEPLQIQLQVKYSKNAIGNGISVGLLKTPLAKLAYPCFLTVIHLGGILLKGYVSNYSEAAMHERMIKIPQLPDRSFWDERENNNEITFLKYIPVNNKGNGLYEYFTFNFKTGNTGNPAQLYFYGEKDFGMFLKKERGLMFGNYSFDGSCLYLKLYVGRDKFSEFKWQRLSPQTSERIREIDKLFTDSYINNIRFESCGIELSCGIIINEVIVSKSKIILLSPDGTRLSIPRDSYPFLQSVTPDTIPIAYLDRNDGKIYIEWEQSGCRIALEEFTRM